MQCTLPYTYGNIYQCILDGAFLNIDEPTIPGITFSKSSSVPKTTATTPLKGSSTTEGITTAPEGSLLTSSHQDITLATKESSTSKSTMVPPDEMSQPQGTPKSTTPLPGIDATSVVSGESTNKRNIIHAFYKVKTRQMFITLWFFLHSILYLTSAIVVQNVYH